MNKTQSHPLQAHGLPAYAISVRQPFAWAIMQAGKDVENRTWRTPYRGRILIHASKTMNKTDWDNHTFLREYLRLSCPMKYDLGGIVGVVNVVDCVDFVSSPWFHGPVGWKLTEPKRIPFIPCGGALGLFKPCVTAEFLKAVLGDWALEESEY